MDACALPGGGLDVLHRAFVEFAAQTQECAWERGKDRMAGCQDILRSGGLCAVSVLSLLRTYPGLIGWEGMDPERFARFYRFIFHACRDSNRRALPAGTAVQAWQLLLRGRFRLLPRWCAFVLAQSSAQCTISEDTWRQVLDFCRTVHEDLSNYDPSGAWPVLLDEFVDSLRRDASGRVSRSSTPGELDHLLMPGGAEAAEMFQEARMAALSPHSGSKRRCRDAGAPVHSLQRRRCA